MSKRFAVFCACLAFISLPFYGASAAEDEDCFVQRDGNHLVLNGHPYYFNSGNNDHLYHWSHFMIDDVLEDAKGLGLTALRVWASSEGENSFKDGFCFQPNPRQYHEPTFLQMDYIISKAREKGIRLIVPLVNNWDDGYGGMPQYVRWVQGDPKDWASKHILKFDLYNAGSATCADVAIRTGDNWTWYESKLFYLGPGWNYNITYDLTSSEWKSEATGWQYTSPLYDRDQVKTFGIGVFEYGEPGAVYIDNIRFDDVLYDGLETLGGWYATDWSYSTGVEISSEQASQGAHSLKMNYSYSAGEYNKAFAEMQPQIDKNAFFTDASCRQLYKDYINYFLNRTNTITGIAYKDDPTILMWELANEPRCESDPTGDTLQAWIEEMAGYIKGLDPNHLVSTGEEGWYDIEGSTDWKFDGRLGADYIRNNQCQYIDVCSFHLYPEGYGLSDADALDWIQRHNSDAKSVINKPVYLGEYGITADRKAVILNDFDTDNEGWVIDWNYAQGPVQVESPSRNDNGSICYTAAIDAVKTSCGGRILYPDPGVDYSSYDYFSGWVYLPPSAPSDLTAEMYMHSGDNWQWASGTNKPLVPGQWTQVRLTKSQIEGWGGDTSRARDLGIQVKRANTDYSGEVYYDVVGANLKDIHDAAYQMARRNELYPAWFNSLYNQDADGAGFWQLFAHRDDGTLFPDYWNWAIYYPEDEETSRSVQLFSALMKHKSGQAATPVSTCAVSPAAVDPQEPFSLTITGEASVPLDSVWWLMEDKLNPGQPGNIPGTVDGVLVNLALEQGFGSGRGELQYAKTMTVTVDNAGEYRIKAFSRDILYPVLGDSHQGSSSADIPVGRQNSSPVFAVLPASYTVKEGQALSFGVSATDADGDQMSLECLGLPAGASFVAFPTEILPDGTSIIKGRFDWTPSPGQAGTYSVQFKARDAQAAETLSLPVQLIVTSPNSPPRILYVRNFFNLWIAWLGWDKEDHYRLKYFYRVDQKPWVGPTLSREPRVSVWQLVRQFRLKRGMHLFEVKARDSQGAESEVKGVKFRVW